MFLTDYATLMKKMRIRAGLTQEQLAALLNRTKSCICKFEKGDKLPDIHTFMSWVRATDATEVAVAVLCGVDTTSIIQQVMGMLFTLWLI
ncbi:helix-turn-helix domain-containing protein [Brevibacillus sp. SIMBA_040]